MARRGPNSGGGKRDRILRAAVKIFSGKGSSTRRCPRSPGPRGRGRDHLLYFRNKDDLLIPFSRRRWGGGGDVRRRIAAGGNALDRLRIFIENHLDLLERESGLVEVLQVELRRARSSSRTTRP